MSVTQCTRDRHLFGPGPKRILALDGGGVRGAVSLAFLERIEQILTSRFGPDFRLGDYFDLVGGTSTGAIIAGALALGYRTKDIRKFYFDLAPLVFRRRRRSIPVLQAKFDAQELRRRIEEIVGSRTLDTSDLVTGFALVAKRMDTGSSWIVSNNPRAPFWEDGPGYLGNRQYPLASLVRASTAAPHYFEPELIAIAENRELARALALPTAMPLVLRAVQTIWRKMRGAGGLQDELTLDRKRFGLFVDGGVSPYGSPALALLHLVTFKAFGICWPTGVEHLRITSIGTGSYRLTLEYDDLGFARFPQLALHSLMSLMSDTEILTLTLMQWMGRCKHPWSINAEIGGLDHDEPAGGKMFVFERYNIQLESEWLQNSLGRQFSQAQIAKLRQMDDPSTVPILYEIASAAAEQQVEPSDWN